VLALEIAALPDAPRSLVLDESIDGALALARRCVQSGLLPLFDASLEALARANRRLKLTDVTPASTDSALMPPPPARAPGKRVPKRSAASDDAAPTADAAAAPAEAAEAAPVQHVALARAGEAMLCGAVGALM
jgi:hypothetical protein